MYYKASQDGEVLSIQDPENGFTIRSSAMTNVGMVRGNNEDSVKLWTFGALTLAIVADGMGGAAAGEEASRLTVEAVQSDFVESVDNASTWKSFGEDEIVERLRHALTEANEAVLSHAAQDHQLQGMGTTATMVFLIGTRAIFAHVGDSRAYWVDGTTQTISRVTNDHSFVEALVLSGHLTREQAELHPMKNVLYRALGQKPEEELEIDIYTHDMSAGDRLVLCSDGLPRHVSDSEIAEIALNADNPKDIASQLIDLANSRGGEDNVSAVVLIVDEA